MRIVVDLQGCQNGGRGRGIGRYGMALTRAMATAGRGHEVVVVLNAGFAGTIGPIRADLADVIPQDRILAMALPARVNSADPDNAWRTRAAEIQRAQFIDGLAPDLIFTTALFEGYHDRTVASVEPQRAPTAVTVYDFIPMDYPEVYLPSDGIRAAYARKLRDARRADLLLPISRYVADETVARLGVPPDRVVSAPLGVERHFRPVDLDAAARDALLKRCGVTRPFVLNTSPVEFRKNLGRLIDGFAAMSPDVREAHQLVIVGRVSAEQRRELHRRAQLAGLPGDALVLPGFVPDEDLVALYGACELFAFPSLSEGFGLPVLEAMACGAPVIGASTTSIPEVIGREDLLFDPADARGLGGRMEAVLRDALLRKELRDYGIARAAPFTWERTAQTVLDAFERVVRGRPPSAASSVPRRPSLAVVVDAPVRLGDEGRGALLTLCADYEITLVDDRAQDRPIFVGLEGPTLDGFPGVAAAFDRIVYLVDDAPTLATAALMRAFPGVSLQWSPSPAAGERAFAIRPDAAAEPLSPVRDAEAGLALEDGFRAVVEAHPASVRNDRARRLATALPTAVRGVAPDADDLADLAEAAARNEALLRPACLWLDVRWEQASDELVRSALRSARRHFEGVVRLCGRPKDGRAAVDGAGESPGDAPATAPEKGEADFRPGDRLLLFGLPSDALADLQRAADAGAILVCAWGPADMMDALFARAVTLGWSARPELHLVEAVRVGDEPSGLVTQVERLTGPGLPLHVVAAGASPETAQALWRLCGGAARAS